MSQALRPAPLFPHKVNVKAAVQYRPAAPTKVAVNLDGVSDRRRAISEIRQMNPTASVAFLETFGLTSLRDYAEHLRHARQKHVRLPGWVQRRTMRLAEARRTLRKAA